MDWNLLPPKPMSSANLSSAMVGSAPGDKTKISGAQQFESAKLFDRSNGGGSTNFLPSFSITKCVTFGITLGRKKCFVHYLRNNYKSQTWPGGWSVKMLKGIFRKFSIFSHCFQVLTLSGRIHLSTIILWNSFSFVSQSPGSSASCGALSS